MKRIKVIIGVIAVIVLGFIVFPVIVETKAAEDASGYSYDIQEDGTARVTGYKGSETEIEIPSRIDGYLVTCIGSEWMGTGWNNLTSIKLPDSITRIEGSTFFRCWKLKNIEIPNGVTSIGYGAFDGCGLTNIILPDNLTSLGDSAFSGCRSLTSINIPKGVTNIGGSTFSGCANLVDITIPDEVTNIGSYAFSGCTSLTSIKLPAHLASINEGCFQNCSSLTSIMLPGKVTSVGMWAFSECSSLKSVVIPDSVTSIEDNACLNLPSDYTIYTVPGSYAANFFDSSHIAYLYEPQQEDYLGFITDRIIIPPFGTARLSEYLLTSLNLNDCCVSVSDEDLFYYDNGIIAALGEGQGSLTISSGELSATISLLATSEAVSTTGVELNKSELVLKKGEAELLSFNLSPENATENKVSWTSSDESVATVNNGMITAIKPGTAEITAVLSTNEQIIDSCEVTVIAPLQAIITTETISPYMLQPGQSEKLTYYLYPYDATDVSLSFSSSAPDIISVNENGILTAIDNGTAQITISTGDISTTVDVTAFTPLTGLSLEQKTVIASCGDTVTLTPIYEPENTTEREIAWTSSKETVATVDENGFVTVHGRGIATITATAGSFTATCDIVCNSHNWAEEYTVDKEATCAEAGSESIHCAGCGSINETTIREIPATGHTEEVLAAVAPTCTETGLTEGKKCSVCGETLVAQEEIPANGHTEETLAEIPATCTEDGLTEGKKCSVCGETLVAQIVVPALGHDYQNDVCTRCGDALKNGWKQEKGIWYYYTSGIAATGWKQVGGKWYLFNSAGAMLTGWQKDGGTWYYLNPSGAMVTGWQQIGGTWYFFKSSGAMAANEWCGGYWLNANGSWTYKPVGSWKKDGTGWWFGDTSGWYAKNTTIKIDDVWYKFNAAGYWMK